MGAPLCAKIATSGMLWTKGSRNSLGLMAFMARAFFAALCHVVEAKQRLNGIPVDLIL